jgi:hypothetical protein
MTRESAYFWLHVSAAIVILGVVVEETSLFVKIFKELKNNGLKYFSVIAKHRILKIFDNVGFIILVVALAFELDFQSLAEKKESDRSNEQQDKIIALESPRHFVPNQRFISAGKAHLTGKIFDLSAGNEFEPMTLAIEIRRALLSIGMKEQLSNALNHWTPAGGEMPIGEIIRPGVAVRGCESRATVTPTPATILGGVLADSGLGSKDSPVFVEPADEDDCLANPNLLHVEVGSKILIPWQPKPGQEIEHPKLLLTVPTGAANTP